MIENSMDKKVSDDLENYIPKIWMEIDKSNI